MGTRSTSTLPNLYNDTDRSISLEPSVNLPPRALYARRLEAVPSYGTLAWQYTIIRVRHHLGIFGGLWSPFYDLGADASSAGLLAGSKIVGQLP
jgi:hypothetical protein